MLLYLSSFLFLGTVFATPVDKPEPPAGPVDTPAPQAGSTVPEIDGVLKHLLEKARQQIAIEAKEEIDQLCKATPGWEDQIKFTKAGKLEKVPVCTAMMFYRENEKLGRIDPETKVISSAKVEERFPQLSALVDDENTKNFYAKYVDALKQCEDGKKTIPKFEVDTTNLPATVTKEQAELASKSLHLQMCGMEYTLPKGTTLRDTYNTLKAELKHYQKPTETAESEEEKNIQALITALKEDMRRKIANGCYEEINGICKADKQWPSEVTWNAATGNSETVGVCLASLFYCESKKLGLLDPETGVLDSSKVKARYEQMSAMESNELKKDSFSKYSDCVQQCADGKYSIPKFTVDASKAPKGITEDEVKKATASLYLQTCGLKCRLPPKITVEQAYESMKSELHYLQEAIETKGEAEGEAPKQPTGSSGPSPLAHQRETEKVEV